MKSKTTLEPQDVAYVLLKIIAVLSLITGLNYFAHGILSWATLDALSEGERNFQRLATLIQFLTALGLFALGHFIWASTRRFVRFASAVEDRKTAVLSLSIMILGVSLTYFSIPTILQQVLVIKTLHFSPMLQGVPHPGIFSNPRFYIAIFTPLFLIVLLFQLSFRSKRLARYISRTNPQNGGFHKRLTCFILNRDKNSGTV